MQLIERIKSVLPQKWSVNTAVKLGLWVAVALIVFQALAAIPTLWSNETHLMSHASRSGYSHVNTWIERNPKAPLYSVPLSTSMQGLRFRTPGSDAELATVGDANWHGLKQLGSAESRREGSILFANWSMQYAGRPVSVDAQINIDNLVMTSRMNALLHLATVTVISLLGGLAAWFLAARMFLFPMFSTLGAIRNSRQASAAGVPASIEHESTNELDLFTDEFNNLIEEQQKAARQVQVKQQYLEYAAHHDPLTHLSNRLMFEDRLKDTVQAAVRDGEQFALFIVDLDNFKFFNDQYGHLIGDKMVVEVGQRLKSMMRDIDLVARLDGDEFVVIQKDIYEKESIVDIAKRIMSVVTAPFEYRGFTLKASVSVGVAYFPDDVHMDHDEERVREEIVNNAAVALQEAKTNGKNQYQLFNESMRKRLTDRIRIEQDLKNALAENQFEVYYQPKINIQTREVTGAEALVRWIHPTEGRISPELFVPVAEEAGLIIEIGEWILRTACRQTRMLQQLGFNGLNVAVNISAVQFTDGNLLPMVSKALKDSQLQPELLELEITESAVMHDPEDVILSLHELSRFGMRLAIDDFGTGYSSLAYLKRFPVDTLKIDRAFITDISSDNDDVAIVEAVLGLGKHFNMKIVAEGVEDEDQLNFLADQGCDLAQGYFISQPMTLQEYISWLEQWPFGISGSIEGAAAKRMNTETEEPLKKAS